MKIAECISGLIGYTKKLGLVKIIDFQKTKESIGLFRKGLVPARVYETDIPLTRWVDKSLYLKSLYFIIFKLRLDVIYNYLIIKPQRVLNLFIKK